MAKKIGLRPIHELEARGGYRTSMSFERSFFFGRDQKDLEDSSGEETTCGFFLRRCDWAKQKQRTVRR
jgi:hypothetical protein